MSKTNISKHQAIGNAFGETKAELFRLSRQGEDLDMAVPEIVHGLHDRLAAIVSDEVTVSVPLPDSWKKLNPEDTVELEKTTWQMIEKLALDAVFNEDASMATHQRALTELLYRLSESRDAQDLASTAVYAVFRRCSSLHDGAIVHIISKGAKGASA